MPGMAADPGGGVVMFGGAQNYTAYAETWTWSGAWHKHSVASTPSKRTRPLMALDTGCKLALLYGGEFQASANSNTQYYDSWAWNGQAWTKVG